MNDSTREKWSIARRTVLGIAGLTILSGCFLKQETADSDVTVSINEECSSASIEMHPSDGKTLTGVIESLDGSETVQTPAGGQTVTGGGSGTIQLTLSSPMAHIRRALVVEGHDLEGPIIVEETCENDNEDQQ